MIDVKELRVGNMLLNDGVIVTIDARSIFDIWDTSDVYSPIPLTPEILERCGFEWENTKKKHLQYTLPKQGINDRKISFLYLDGECKMLQYYMSDYFYGYFETKPPKYLHQLQNLYFALTGEELPFKENIVSQAYNSQL